MLLFCLQIAIGVSDEKLQPLLPSDAPTDLAVLVRLCCDYDPEMRPTFSNMVPQLEATIDQMKVCVKDGTALEWLNVSAFLCLLKALFVALYCTH